MYTLIKQSEFTYNIKMQDKTIGTVALIDKKWYAKIGKLSTSKSSRKKAVEGLLYNIIMNQIGKERMQERLHIEA